MKFTTVLTLNVLSLVLLAFGSQPVKAEDDDKVDHMLDELEKRLEKKEAGFLSTNENELFDAQPSELKLDLDPAMIKTKLPGTDELQKISDRLVGIKNDIDDISGKIMKMSYDLIHSESAYKHARLSLKIEQKSSMQLESLQVRLDGVEIYNLDRRDAFLLNSQDLPVYIGPMTKGKHAIEFDLALRQREKDMKSVLNQQEKIINQALEFSISDGENAVDFLLKQEGSGKLALQQGLPSKN